VSRSVKVLQPRARVGQAYPFCQAFRVIVFNPRPIILDPESYRLSEALGLYLDQACGCARRDCMPDRVFDQGLEDKIRNTGIKRRRINKEPDGQAILKSRLLDFEIPLKELDLLFKRDFLRPAIFERNAKQVAQSN
jgi:hypothetical protein